MKQIEDTEKETENGKFSDNNDKITRKDLLYTQGKIIIISLIRSNSKYLEEEYFHQFKFSLLDIMNNNLVCQLSKHTIGCRYIQDLLKCFNVDSQIDEIVQNNKKKK